MIVDTNKPSIDEMRKKALKMAKADVKAVGTGTSKNIAKGEEVTLSQKQFDILSAKGYVKASK